MPGPGGGGKRSWMHEFTSSVSMGMAMRFHWAMRVSSSLLTTSISAMVVLLTPDLLASCTQNAIELVN